MSFEFRTYEPFPEQQQGATQNTGSTHRSEHDTAYYLTGFGAQLNFYNNTFPSYDYRIMEDSQELVATTPMTIYQQTMSINTPQLADNAPLYATSLSNDAINTQYDATLQSDDSYGHGRDEYFHAYSQNPATQDHIQDLHAQGLDNQYIGTGPYQQSSHNVRIQPNWYGVHHPGDSRAFTTLVAQNYNASSPQVAHPDPPTSVTRPCSLCVRNEIARANYNRYGCTHRMDNDTAGYLLISSHSASNVLVHANMAAVSENRSSGWTFVEAYPADEENPERGELS